REAFAAASANACRSTGEAEMANDTVDVLNDLIKTCNDGAKGFTAAANIVSAANQPKFAGNARTGRKAATNRSLLGGLFNLGSICCAHSGWFVALRRLRRREGFSNCWWKGFAGKHASI
ncbi:MAG TPA: hypothetical protein VGN52_11495, partial [Burkholderiales bacterium]